MEFLNLPVGQKRRDRSRSSPRLGLSSMNVEWQREVFVVDVGRIRGVAVGSPAGRRPAPHFAHESGLLSVPTELQFPPFAQLLLLPLQPSQVVAAVLINAAADDGSAHKDKRKLSPLRTTPTSEVHADEGLLLWTDITGTPLSVYGGVMVSVHGWKFV